MSKKKRQWLRCFLLFMILCAQYQYSFASAEIDVPMLSRQDLIVNETPSMYTYEDLENDLWKLQSLCGDIIQINRLCDTADGRGVYDVVLGDPAGSNQVLMIGAMHAREYITTQVVMRQLLDAIDAKMGHGGDYAGVPLLELLSNVTIHFIPMNNPDGVTISQKGANGLNRKDLRDFVVSVLDDDVEQWKANGAGVDLNRNFDAGWHEFVGSAGPAMERFKGKYPGSEPETAALIRLTEDSNIRRAITYHTCGALIYWYYKQEGDVLDISKEFAESISKETGYPLDYDYMAVDAAGYKDWAVYKAGVPTLTIEVGCENGEELVNPVPISRFGEIWERNKNVVYAVLFQMKQQDSI